MTAMSHSLSSQEQVAEEVVLPVPVGTARPKHSRLFNVSSSCYNQPLHVYRIKKDGNCLFRALAYRLHRNEEQHASVRERIVKNVLENWTRYGDFATCDAHDIAIRSGGDYERYMGAEGVHGGHLELEVAADVFNMRIKLVHCDGANFNRRFGRRRARKRLTLLYTGDGDNGHYDVCVQSPSDKGPIVDNNDSLKLKGQCESSEPLKSHGLSQLPEEEGEVICERFDVATATGSAQTDNDTLTIPNQPELASSPSPSLPPNELRIEIGNDVVLIRNICKSNVLSDGTRLIIRDATNRIPTCLVATGNQQGTTVPLRRIYLKANDENSLQSLFRRTQIPDQLAFVNSITKTHGRLYIALSRGRFIPDIRAHFAGSNSADRNQVTNISMR